MNWQASSGIASTWTSQLSRDEAFHTWRLGGVQDWEQPPADRLNCELVKALKVYRLQRKGTLLFPGPAVGRSRSSHLAHRVWSALHEGTGPNWDVPRKLEESSEQSRSFLINFKCLVSS